MSLVFLFGNFLIEELDISNFPFMNIIVKPQNLLKLHFGRIISFLPKDSPMWFFLSKYLLEKLGLYKVHGISGGKLPYHSWVSAVFWLCLGNIFVMRLCLSQGVTRVSCYCLNDFIVSVLSLE